MRILVATSHGGVVGGQETHVRALLPLLRARGHEVALLCDRSPLPGEGALHDLCPEVPRFYVSELGEEGCLAAAAAWRPTLLYLHALASPAFEEALAERFPVLFFSHAYHGTCPSTHKRFALPRVRLCHRTFGPACLALYFPRRCGGRNPLSLLSLYALQARRLRLLRRVARVAVASEHMRREYLRHGLDGARVDHLPLFPTGVTPLPEPPSPRAPKGRILLLGRLSAPKGGSVLVDAAARAQRQLGRPLTLVIAGEGPERPALEAQARRLGVALELHGWVPAERRNVLMGGADVLAIPSLWPEPFGLVGMEAGCLGLPAVGFAAGGIPEWLRPGETGELAPGEVPTAAGLGDALVRVLGDPAHLAHLGRGAWQMARRFTPEAHLDRLERAFEATIGSVGSSDA